MKKHLRNQDQKAEHICNKFNPYIWYDSSTLKKLQLVWNCLYVAPNIQSRFIGWTILEFCDLGKLVPTANLFSAVQDRGKLTTALQDIPLQHASFSWNN